MPINLSLGLGVGDVSGPQGSGTPAYTGPLDIVAGGAIAFSQRRMASAFSSNVIQINNGTTTQNFTASTNDAVDPAAITSFIGGGSGTVATWYDQSGNARNVSQGTRANQPTWLSSGPNSLPTISFDSSNNQRLNTASNVSLAAQLTIFTVFKNNSTSGTVFGSGVISSPGSGQFTSTFSSGGTNGFRNLNVLGDAGSGNGPQLRSSPVNNTIGTYTLVDLLLDGTNIPYNGSIFLNGSNVTDAAVTGTAGFSSFSYIYTVGANDDQGTGVGVFFSGEIVEHLLYLSGLTTGQRLSIRQNIATYYGITLP